MIALREPWVGFDGTSTTPMILRIQSQVCGPPAIEQWIAGAGQKTLKALGCPMGCGLGPFHRLGRDDGAWPVHVASQRSRHQSPQGRVG